MEVDPISTEVLEVNFASMEVKWNKVYFHGRIVLLSEGKIYFRGSVFRPMEVMFSLPTKL